MKNKAVLFCCACICCIIVNLIALMTMGENVIVQAKDKNKIAFITVTPTSIPIPTSTPTPTNTPVPTPTSKPSVEDKKTGNKMLVYYSIGNFVNWTSSTGNKVANRMVGE